MCSKVRLNSGYGYELFKDDKDYLYLEPQADHKDTLIWTHGLGDSAMGFLDVFFTNQFKVVPSTTKVILMTAPTRPVTINNGMSMPSWYDILSMELSSGSKDLDYGQLHESYELVSEVVQNELQHVGNDWSKVHLGGFSQGACLTYYCVSKFG